MAGHDYPGITLDLRDLERSRLREPTLHYPIGLPESYGAESAILPIRELAMLMLMDNLTDKPNWHEKVFDESIVAKWREEALSQSEDALFERIMDGKSRHDIPKPKIRIVSKQAFDFCVQELRAKAEYFKESRLIPTLDAAGNTVVKSDSLVDEELHNKLVDAFKALKEDQAGNVDWHPNSNDMVQDMVHPSMYPFVYDRSQFIKHELVGTEDALDFIGQGKLVHVRDDFDEEKYRQHGYSWRLCGALLPDFWSDKYQWLPSNVSFREDGSAKLTSYINNLHPVDHEDIYGAIERVIDTAIPAWDQCLRRCEGYKTVTVAGRTASRFEQIKEATDEDDSLWCPELDVAAFKDYEVEVPRDVLEDLEMDGARCADPDSRVEVTIEEQNQREEQGLPPLMPNVADEDLALVKWKLVRDALLPEPKDFDSEEVNYAPGNFIKNQFEDRGLQVIVKMASIELTPEKPEFPAGGWHIEGQMNEKICATALYYLDSENVTPSHLSFRMQTSHYLNDDIETGQDQYNYVERVYGTNLSYEAALQNYGDVETRQGRLLAFPNVFQHRVSSFKLADPSKPGHRRFIALWLIDPHRRIVSTANVPPQRKDWWEQSVDKQEAEQSNVPAGLMTVEEAREHRLSLMMHRTAYSGKAEDARHDLTYHFCEH